MKYRLRAEHPTHFEVEDGQGLFRVAKAGLDSELVKRIQSFADGGPVGGGAGEEVPPLDVTELPDSGVSPEMRISGKGPQRLKTESEQYPKGNALFDDPRGSMPSERPAGANPLTDESATVPAPGLLKYVTGNAEMPGVLAAFRHPIDSFIKGVKLTAKAVTPQSVQDKVGENIAENEKPSVTESAPPRQPPKPAGAPRPAIAGGASPGRLGEPPAPTAAPDAEAAAMRGQADVASRQGAEESSAIKDQMGRMAELEAHRQAMASQWDAEYKGQLRKYSEAVDRYSNTEIQPDRLWASRSTGDKMLAGVGMMLSAFGPGDVNRSVELIDRAISQDIEVQKSNLERLGKSAGMQQNLLGIMREHFGDDMAAEAAAREAMTANAELRLKEVSARYQGPQAQANAAAGIAALQTKRSQWQSEFDLKAKATASEVAKNYAQANKLGAAGAGSGTSSAVLQAIDAAEKAYKNRVGSPRQYAAARKSLATLLAEYRSKRPANAASVESQEATMPDLVSLGDAGQWAQLRKRVSAEAGVSAPSDESGFEE